MKQQAAVLGVGQTRHRARRSDVSIAGLCREAVDRALADAGTAPADIASAVKISQRWPQAPAERRRC